MVNLESIMGATPEQLLDDPNQILEILYELQVSQPDSYQNRTLAAIKQIIDEKAPEFLADVAILLERDICQAWKDRPVQEVIAFILQVFHTRHRQMLLDIISAAHRVESVYAEHPLCPLGLGRLVTELMRDLCDHMEQEEAFLFPNIIKSGEKGLFPELAIMHHSHDRHLGILNEILNITNNLLPPDEAGADWLALYNLIQEFIFQLRLHIALENELIFTA